MLTRRRRCAGPFDAKNGVTSARSRVRTGEAVPCQLKDDANYRVIARRSAIKNLVSLALYAASVPLAFVHPSITLALAFLVAAIYFPPDAWIGKGKRGDGR